MQGRQTKAGYVPVNDFEAFAAAKKTGGEVLADATRVLGPVPQERHIRAL